MQLFANIVHASLSQRGYDNHLKRSERLARFSSASPPTYFRSPRHPHPTYSKSIDGDDTIEDDGNQDYDVEDNNSEKRTSQPDRSLTLMIDFDDMRNASSDVSLASDPET
nr:hypothetical protein CFP56_07620 [Quercus suber]